MKYDKEYSKRKTIFQKSLESYKLKGRGVKIDGKTALNHKYNRYHLTDVYIRSGCSKNPNRIIFSEDFLYWQKRVIAIKWIKRLVILTENQENTIKKRAEIEFIRLLNLIDVDVYRIYQLWEYRNTKQIGASYMKNAQSAIIQKLPESMETPELEKHVWREGLVKIAGYFNGRVEGTMAKVALIAISALARDKAATTQRMKLDRQIVKESKKIKELKE